MNTRLKNAVIFYGFYSALLLAAWIIWSRLFWGLLGVFSFMFAMVSVWDVCSDMLNKLVIQYKGTSIFDSSLLSEKEIWQKMNILDKFLSFFALPGIVTLYELTRLIEKISTEEIED